MPEFDSSAIQWHLAKVHTLLDRAKRLSLIDRSVIRICKELIEIKESLEFYAENRMFYDEPEVGNRLRKIEKSLELVEKKINSFS
jgi:hypothetical protein